jgi:hypothetical protein
MTQGTPTTSAAVPHDVVEDDDEAIDMPRLLRRAAIAAIVLAGGLGVVVVAAVVRAAPSHETAQRLADAVMGNASGPVVVDRETFDGLARFNVEVQRAEVHMDDAASGLSAHHGGDSFTLPRLFLAGLGHRGATTIATFADDVARFLRAARSGGGACCGAFKATHCEVRATTERPVLPFDTELFVDCRDANDNLLTFVVDDGAVVQVVSSTVGRTALAVRTPHR